MRTNICSASSLNNWHRFLLNYVQLYFLIERQLSVYWLRWDIDWFITGTAASSCHCSQGQGQAECTFPIRFRRKKIMYVNRSFFSNHLFNWSLVMFWNVLDNLNRLEYLEVLNSFWMEHLDSLECLNTYWESGMSVHTDSLECLNILRVWNVWTY